MRGAISWITRWSFMDRPWEMEICTTTNGFLCSLPDTPGDSLRDVCTLKRRTEHPLQICISHSCVKSVSMTWQSLAIVLGLLNCERVGGKTNAFSELANHASDRDH